MAHMFQKIYEMAVGSFSEDDTSDDGQSSLYTSDSSDDSRGASRRKRAVANANSRQREREKPTRGSSRRVVNGSGPRSSKDSSARGSNHRSNRKSQTTRSSSSSGRVSSRDSHGNDDRRGHDSKTGSSRRGKNHKSQEAVIDAMLDSLGEGEEVPVSEEDDEDSAPVPIGKSIHAHTLLKPSDNRYKPAGRVKDPTPVNKYSSVRTSSPGDYRRNTWDNAQNDDIHANHITAPIGHAILGADIKDDEYSLGPVGGLPSIDNVQFALSHSLRDRIVTDSVSIGTSDRYTSFKRGDPSFAEDSFTQDSRAENDFPTNPVISNVLHETPIPKAPSHRTYNVSPGMISNSNSKIYQQQPRKRIGSQSLIEMSSEPIGAEICSPKPQTQYPSVTARVANYEYTTDSERPISAGPNIPSPRNESSTNRVNRMVTITQPQRTYTQGKNQTEITSKTSNTLNHYENGASQLLETSLSYSQSEQEGSSINSSSHMSYSHTSNSDYMGVGEDDGVRNDAESRLIALVQSDQPNSHAQVMNILLNPPRSLEVRKRSSSSIKTAAVNAGIYKQQGNFKHQPQGGNVVNHASSSDASEASSLTEEDESSRRLPVGGLNLRDLRAPRSAPSPVPEEHSPEGDSERFQDLHPSDAVSNGTPSDISNEAETFPSPPKLKSRLGAHSLAAKSTVESTLLAPLSHRRGSPIAALQHTRKQVVITSPPANDIGQTSLTSVTSSENSAICKTLDSGVSPSKVDNTLAVAPEIYLDEDIDNVLQKSVSSDNEGKIPAVKTTKVAESNKTSDTQFSLSSIQRHAMAGIMASARKVITLRNEKQEKIEVPISDATKSVAIEEIVESPGPPDDKDEEEIKINKKDLDNGSVDSNPSLEGIFQSDPSPIKPLPTQEIRPELKKTLALKHYGARQLQKNRALNKVSALRKDSSPKTSPRVLSNNLKQSKATDQKLEMGSILSQRKTAATSIQRVLRGYLTRENLLWETGVALRRSLEIKSNYNRALMLHSAIRSKAVAIMRSNPLIITGLYLTICKVCASGIQAWYRRCILRVLSRQQKIEAANRILEDAATMFQKLVRGVQARELALEMFASVIVIQSFFRKSMCQTRFYAMIESQYSAIACQALIRGWLSRVRVERMILAAVMIKNFFIKRRNIRQKSRQEDFHGFESLGQFNFDTESEFIGFDLNVDTGADFSSFNNPFQSFNSSSFEKIASSMPEPEDFWRPPDAVDTSTSTAFSSSFSLDEDSFNMSSFADQTMPGDTKVRRSSTKSDNTKLRESREVKAKTQEPSPSPRNVPPPPPPSGPPPRRARRPEWSRSASVDPEIAYGAATQKKTSERHSSTSEGPTRARAGPPPPPKTLPIASTSKGLTTPPPPPPPPPQRASKHRNSLPKTDVAQPNPVIVSQNFGDNPGFGRIPSEISTRKTASPSSTPSTPVSKGHSVRHRRVVSDLTQDDRSAVPNTSKNQSKAEIVETRGSRSKNIPLPPSRTRSDAQGNVVTSRSPSVGSRSSSPHQSNESASPAFVGDSVSAPWKDWEDEGDEEIEFNKRRPKMKSSLLQKDSTIQKVKKHLIPSGFSKSKRSSSSSSEPYLTYVPPSMSAPVVTVDDDTVVATNVRNPGLVTPSPRRMSERAHSNESGHSDQLSGSRNHRRTQAQTSSDRASKRGSAKGIVSAIVSPESVQRTTHWD